MNLIKPIGFIFIAISFVVGFLFFYGNSSAQQTGTSCGPNKLLAIKDGKLDCHPVGVTLQETFPKIGECSGDQYLSGVTYSNPDSWSLNCKSSKAGYNLGDLAEVKAGNVKCDIDGEKFVGIKSDGTPICTKYDTQNTHNSNCQLMGTRLFPYGRNLENSQYAVDSNAPKIGVNDPETINDLKINVRDYDYVEVGLISTIYTPSTSNPTGSLKKTGVSIHSNNVNTQRFAVKANSDHRLDIYSGFNSTNKGSINKYPLHIGKPHVSTKPEGNEAFVLDFDVHYGYYKTEGHYYIAYIRGYDLVCGTDHSGPNDKLKLFTPEEEDDSITCTSGHEWNSIERICEKSCPVGYQLHGEVCKNVCHH